MYDAITPHVPFLRSHAEALAGSAMGADDLLREVLLHALAKSHQVGPNTDLRAWLFTIMHNQHARRGRRSGGKQAGPDHAPRRLERNLELDTTRLGQALAILPDAHRQLMAAVADATPGKPSNGSSAPLGPVNLPSRRVHPKTTGSSRCLAEPTRRIPGRPRVAATPEWRRP